MKLSQENLFSYQYFTSLYYIHSGQINEDDILYLYQQNIMSHHVRVSSMKTNI